ncbi:MAG: hypothetical protein ABI042_05660 [Verrucomicrobiota bacterium]
MSRWKSPQTAAKQAERSVKKAGFSKIGSVALFAALFIKVNDASALPPLSRERDGKIEHIDRERHLITVTLANGEWRSVFHWKKDTRFVQNVKFVSAEQLQEGQPVRVRYHSPFFGDRYVCRVFLKNSASSPN